VLGRTPLHQKGLSWCQIWVLDGSLPRGITPHSAGSQPAKGLVVRSVLRRTQSAAY